MPDQFEAAVQIFSAYVANHQVDRKDLEDLAREVSRAVAHLGESGPVPAVPVEDSYTDDEIICLEDGQPVKLLTRYLKTHHGMTPEDYRSKWGLPEDYPFVAKSYSEKRSKIAKSHGLGKS